MNDLMQFKKAITDLYVQNPCEVLPNALWKSLERLPALELSLKVSTGGKTKDLGAWDEGGLHVFWSQERRIDDTFQDIMAQSRFAIIHDEYFKQIHVHGYNLITPFFRIKHDHKRISSYELSDDFYIKEADPNRECGEISDLIGRCYKDLHPSSDTVKSWTSHATFDKSLWIWIVDRSTNAPAALGIAEYDRNVPEGSLEWIQVLPEYQGRGLGKALVLELLQRLKSRTDFTTVSGEVKSQSSPEKLYRNCGFVGNDVWWLLRK